MIGVLGWMMSALGTALFGDRPSRRLGGAGLLILGLALAAMRVGGDGPPTRGAAPGDSGEGFLVVNGTLLLLGLGLLAWAAVVEIPGPTRLPGRIAVAVGVGLILSRIAGQLLAAGLLGTVGFALAAGVAGAVLAAIARGAASTGPARAVERTLFTEPLGPPAITRGPGTAQLFALLAASALAALGPHVLPVFVGSVVATWSGYALVRSASGHRLPIAPALVLVLLPAYWLLATIAGPVGLGTRELHVVPLSPAAESLLAAAMLLAGWSMAGLWPFHRQLPGALIGLVGALLLGRIAVPLAPGGLEQWRPLVVPVLILGVWHAAAHGRWPLVAVGTAYLGIMSPAPAGVIGAGWLLGAALLLEVAAVAALPLASMRVGQIIAWISAAWGGLLVVEAGLRGEVVYTALGTVGLAVVIVASVAREGHPSLRSE